MGTTKTSQRNDASPGRQLKQPVGVSCASPRAREWRRKVPDLCGTKELRATNQLAIALPVEVKKALRLYRPDIDPDDPMGNDLDHSKRPNFWPIAAQAKHGPPHFPANQAAWMSDNMLHSIATVMGTDIAVLKLSRDPGKVGDIIDLYYANTPHHPRIGSTTWIHRT
eukprot:CAMPEP_0179940780 /NCGR_PEP_ID=MMETSP0983-20121128/16530_1 /TAXON_ID=483367 /ORGANISM="non described non described, Strain CCMP 2436" /LENGTH=166 /DNA_ID=CAMNT_0021847567 /DNA_START=169 /DNA_END=666 /DNA_ORIENTATION=+